jgi:hypothetical protein
MEILLMEIESRFRWTSGTFPQDLSLAKIVKAYHQASSRNEIFLVDNLHQILGNSADGFAEAHVQSLLSLMRRVSTLEGPANLEQQKLIGETEKYFTAKASRKSAW